MRYLWNWINSDRTSCVRSAPRYGDVGTWHWQLLARGQHWWPRCCRVKDFLLIHRDRKKHTGAHKSCVPEAGEHLKGQQQCGLSPQRFSLPCGVSHSEARSRFTLEKRVLVGARGPSWWASTSIQSNASHQCTLPLHRKNTNYRIIILIQKEKLYMVILHIYTQCVSRYMKYKDSQS